MVRVHVWTPTGLTDEERETIEGMRTSESFIPDPPVDRDQRSLFSRVKDVFS